MYFFRILKKKLIFVDFACLPVYAAMDPDAMTFKINGHEASV